MLVACEAGTDLAAGDCYWAETLSLMARKGLAAVKHAMPPPSRRRRARVHHGLPLVDSPAAPVNADVAELKTSGRFACPLPGQWVTPSIT